ncbi:MAG: T9SS type A sorting domain-containing protein, partial [Candidatus Krumholzibacteria bacterium]|nr:T9SS type A sorting domain-containing protein [Candidatus Krumholzibacteria bacterium]
PALARTEDGGGGLLFVSGGPDRILGARQEGVEFASPLSGLSRIRLDVQWNAEGWTMFRRDPGGSGRQDPSGGSIPAGSLADGSSLICYPNPVRGGSFRVRIDLSASADVTLKILTLEGAQVYSAALRHEWTTGRIPFETAVPVDGLASGIYICHLEVRGSGARWTGARKVAVLK